MKPLVEMPRNVASAISGVLCDIDDTLTTDGQLTPEAYAALGRLRGAGLLAIPITGRPAGWCDHIARMWPVDAVVGENGAFYFCYDRKVRKLLTRYRDDAQTRAANRSRLQAVRDTILATVPGAAIASDQHYREADLAIDYCEDVSRLSDLDVDRIVGIMRAAGMTARVSSIHVNGWFGEYDKLATTRILLKERFDIDIDISTERERLVFIGDSPNDAQMFAFFPTAVGVANVRAFAVRLEHLPAYVTRAASGAGFVELANFLLDVRRLGG
ncbi:MAG: HAD-IIB family hydrolase [Burkholderiales bacterium]